MSVARFREVAADLRDRIALGETRRDGGLPSEAELCTHYGVSRMTVRRALEELRDEGLLTSRPGAGWYVAGASIRQPLALGTFNHAASAAISAGQVSREVVEFGYRTLAPPPESEGTDAPGPFGDVLFVRSLRLADGSPLDSAHEYVPATIAAPLSRADAESPGLWESLSRAGHEIARVHQTVTAGAASAADAELLHVAAGTPLLLIRRLALAPDGTMLARADHRYLAHRFSLTVEFSGWTAASATEPPGLNLHDHPDHPRPITHTRSTA